MLARAIKILKRVWLSRFWVWSGAILPGMHLVSWCPLGLMVIKLCQCWWLMKQKSWHKTEENGRKLLQPYVKTGTKRMKWRRRIDGVRNDGPLVDGQSGKIWWPCIAFFRRKFSQETVLFTLVRPIRICTRSSIGSVQGIHSHLTTSNYWKQYKEDLTS